MECDGSNMFCLLSNKDYNENHLISLLYNKLSSISISQPIGNVIMFAGDNIPTGWLAFDGSSVSRSTYARLFSVIGTLYGAGDHVRTFNLPNFQQRFPLGININLRERPGRLIGGVSNITLITAELPAHKHGKGTITTRPAGGHSHNILDPGHNHGGQTGSSDYSIRTFPFA